MDKNIRSEKEILDDIKQIIVTHMGDSGDNIKVEVKGDKVSLWGFVDNMAERDFIAGRIVRTAGVREVDNSLTVADDGKVKDQDMEKQISERFASSRHEGVYKLGVQVNKGVVTLLGHMENQNGVRHAIQLASQVRGVKEIRSQVQLPNGIDDATLVNKVEDAFVKSPWVNAHEIKTMAKNGVVTLTGMVDKPEEIDWAVDTAYQVSGVRAVVSELVSRHRSQGEDLRLTEQLVSQLGQQRLNSGQIRAFVQGGIAHLSGKVYSVEEKERAENIVQNIDGITGIDNDILIDSYSIK